MSERGMAAARSMYDKFLEIADAATAELDAAERATSVAEAATILIAVELVATGNDDEHGLKTILDFMSCRMRGVIDGWRKKQAAEQLTKNQGSKE